MRLEVGALTLEVEHPAEAAPLLELLFRYFNNKELGELLGVTDKTVRRWKREGRLPAGEGGPVTLLQLLQYLDLQPRLPTPPAGATGRPGPAGATDEPSAGDAGAGGVSLRLQPPRLFAPGVQSSAPGSGP
jgi:hypothetical protein